MEPTIEIQGLNQRQCFLADMIWECKDVESVDRFISGLPTASLRTEAETIRQLIVLASFD